jgi:predicted adenylyl cyclase CyaB
LVNINESKGLKEVLAKSIGIKIVVQKSREIYYIENVKFHIDVVPGLGSFVEIEAGNVLATFSREVLKKQCEFYRGEFNISDQDLIEESYSDLLLQSTT